MTDAQLVQTDRAYRKTPQTAPKTFRPSAKQTAYLRAWLDPSVVKTPTTVCRAAGVCTRRYYDWLQNAQFVNWFDAELERHTNHLWKPVLHETARLALKGSPDHIKLLAQIRGEFHEGSESRANVGVTVMVGLPRPGDHVPLPIEPSIPGLPPARSDDEH